ncbi:MAG: hypothetical protein M3P43_13285 [Actinomycetota bacterium]|nr:hypothetical protein [Actinomycetota bacterium]
MSTVASLWVKVNGDVSGLTRSLAVANTALAGFGTKSSSSATKASSAFRVAGAAAIVLGAAAATSLIKSVQATQEWANEVRTLQKVTGQTAEQASGLAAVAGEFGISIDKLNVGFGIFGKNIINSATGLNKYGLATRDAQGNLLPFDVLLGEAADKFVSFGKGIEGTAFAMNVFGRSGRNLIPLLALGAQGLADMEAHAKAMGLVLSQDDVNASRALTIAQAQLSESIKGVEVSIGTQLIPSATKMFQLLASGVQVLSGLPQGFLATVLGVTALTGAFAALFAVGKFFTSTWTKVLEVTKLKVAADLESAGSSATAAGAISLQLDATVALTAALSRLEESLGLAFPVATAKAEAALVGFGATESGLLVPTGALEARVTQLAVAEDLAATSSGAMVIGITALNTAAALAIPVLAALWVGAKVLGTIRWKPISAEDFSLTMGQLEAIHTQITKFTPVNFFHGFGNLFAGANLSPQITKNFEEVYKGFALRAQAAGVSQNVVNQAFSDALPLINANQDSINGWLKDLETSTGLSHLSADATRQYAISLDDLTASLEGTGRQLKSTSSLASTLGQVTGTTAGEATKAFNDAVVSQTAALLKQNPTLDEASARVQAWASVTTDSIAKARASWKQFHDSTVSQLDFLGPSLDQFAGKANVDLGKVDESLRTALSQTNNFVGALLTIERTGPLGKEVASGLLALGPQYAGLTQQIASASGKTRKKLIGDFAAVLAAQQTGASKLTNALDFPLHQFVHAFQVTVNGLATTLGKTPPFEFKTKHDQFDAAFAHIKHQLDTMKGPKPFEFTGQDETSYIMDRLEKRFPKFATGVTIPMKPKDDATAAFDALLAGTPWASLAKGVTIPMKTKDRATGPFVSLLNGTPWQSLATGVSVPVKVHDEASGRLAAIIRQLQIVAVGATAAITVGTGHKGGPVHQGGLIRHDGGPIPHATAVARMHSGGLKPDEVPAILQRGEYVIRRQSVAKIGMPVLDSLNRLHSGGDIGDMLSKIPTAISKVSNPAPSSAAAGASKTIERFHTGGTTSRTREISRTIERMHTGGKIERTFRTVEKLHTGGPAKMALELRAGRGVPQVFHAGGTTSVPAVAVNLSQLAPVLHGGGVVLHSGGLLRQFVVLHSGGTRTQPAIHVHVPSLSVASHQHRVLRFHAGGRMREVRVIERMPVLHSGGMTPQIARLMPLLIAGSLSVFHHGGLRGLMRQVLHDGGTVVPQDPGLRVSGLSQSANRGDVNLKVSLDRRRFGRDLEWAQADFGP